MTSKQKAKRWLGWVTYNSIFASTLFFAVEDNKYAKNLLQFIIPVLVTVGFIAVLAVSAGKKHVKVPPTMKTLDGIFDLCVLGVLAVNGWFLFATMYLLQTFFAQITMEEEK